MLANLPDEELTPSFRLGEARFYVIAAAALDREANGAVVGELKVSGANYLILEAEERETESPTAMDLLTRRELQIVLLVARGEGTKQIAHKLRISPYTVTSYMKRIFCKLNCRTRAEMAALVIQNLKLKNGPEHSHVVNRAAASLTPINRPRV
jgi:DNA-binding CsgD family transcriptional regulator